MNAKITSVFNKACFKIKKHSPEILVIGGVIGVVTSAVMACKATTKVSSIVDEKNEVLDSIHDAKDKLENGETVMTEDGEEYTVEDVKKDTTIVYVQTGIKFVKLYAPSVALGALSIVSILTSNNILRKRNVAIAAAYATVDKAFKEYRGRVVERFGDTVDKELRYNLKSKKVKEKIVDENGEEKTVTKTKFEATDPCVVSGYARYFEEFTDKDENGVVQRNPYWEKDPEHNMFFLKAQQNYANDLLRAKKRLFLNEVYKMLGLPESKAGQIVGWVYDPDNPVGDNYVDFGLHHGSDQYSDFVYGNENAILLDFNVDGNIWDLM